PPQHYIIDDFRSPPCSHTLKAASHTAIIPSRILHTSPRHLLSRVGIFPGPLPEVRDQVPVEGQKRFLEPVVLLAREAGGKKLPQRVSATLFRLLSEAKHAVLCETLDERVDISPVKHILDGWE